MLLGPSRGGVVRLCEADSGVLLIGEGLETCLAAMQATRLPVWSSLSASGLCHLRLPHTIRDVTILADGDEAGRNAAEIAARRWVAQGRRVRIARAPEGFDLNDVLQGAKTAAKEGVA